MVLGNGLVANGFRKYRDCDDYLIFASGVSNSASTDVDAFARERKLLSQALYDHQDKIFIYFSTCSVYDTSLKDSAYVKHKLDMEKLIAERHNDYHIFRVSHLVGRSVNPHTILNFFVQHIISGQHFFLWEKATRNIIDINDAFKVCDYIINHKVFRNKITNIGSKVNYPVMQIVHTIESVFGKKARYSLTGKGADPLVNIVDIERIFTVLNIYFNDEYLEKLIRKYYVAA